VSGSRSTDLREKVMRMRKKNAKLLISIAGDEFADVRVFQVNVKSGKQQELQSGENYTVEHVLPTTARCQACDTTYPLRQIVHTGDEVLCKSCALDLLPIHPEDIPF